MWVTFHFCTQTRHGHFRYMPRSRKRIWICLDTVRRHSEISLRASRAFSKVSGFFDNRSPDTLYTSCLHLACRKAKMKPTGITAWSMPNLGVSCRHFHVLAARKRSRSQGGSSVEDVSRFWLPINVDRGYLNRVEHLRTVIMCFPVKPCRVIYRKQI